MSNPEPKSTPQQSPPPARKRYEAPRLRRFGDVSLLTRSGTVPGMETGMAPTLLPSSRRVKDAIVPVGRHPLGFGLYLFDYRPEYREAYGTGRQFGVIAEEVERVLPEAVSLNAAGHKVVHYDRLGIRVSPPPKH